MNKDIWTKAAVVGSLWASVEIIMGSFFHNLQLPFAGTLLAVFTVTFVIAVLQIWPERGLIWRAGIIAALMKSISPSAVILGPMTGIFFEAVLLELFIFLLGRNLISYIVAGMMAVLSALFHKLITLLIIYGWDAVAILSNVYKFAMKQLSFTQVNPMDAVWILVSIYLILGTLSALMGFRIGKKAVEQKEKQQRIAEFDISSADSFFSISKEQKFSIYLLLFNILSVVAILFIINKWGLYWGLGVASVFLVYILLRYKNAARQFKRPALWMQLLVLTLLASLFYVEDSQIVYFSSKGIFVGLEMTLRAIVVVLGFSSISVELRNPIIKTVLNKKGFSKLYNALGLAFSALPAIMSDVTKPKKMLKNPFKTIVDILLYTDSLYLTFVKSESQNNGKS